MVNILCFGDSNTFGTNPAGGRWPLDVRWTGVLQALLGPGYRIIEEGCGGRTTVFEDEIEQDKNGRAQLRVALRSHRPLDLVILMLGTNDLKHRFAMLPVDVAEAAAGLGRLVERYDYGAGYPVPRVLLVSPIEIGDGISRSRFTGFTEQAAAYSRELAPLFEARARANGWLYLNAASVAKPSPNDRLHMEAADHRALAQALARIVKDAFEGQGE